MGYPSAIRRLPSALRGAQLDLGNVPGLRAPGTVNDFELHCLAFLERAEPIPLDRRVVHEDVTASVALDEPVPLGIVEPLDLTCDAHRSFLRAVTQNRVVEHVRDQKKGPQCLRPFPLRRQARPASAEIIADLSRYV